MATCAQMQPTFWEILASTIVKDSNGDIYFNVICYNADCADLASAIECGDQVNNLEAFIVANGFGVDSCGLPAIKLRVCVDADAENALQ